MTNKTYNRLQDATSPYLLQHAQNPVDWYPWCPEAFDKAKAEDKPIFLSIGYSTCHWCHVMAHESFENKNVADFLNRHFIAIKVDKEERPDIDSVYMSVCQAVTGQGGWPLTILMTPAQQPFWAGTYLPPQSQYGRPGLLELLTAAAQQWQRQRPQLLQAGQQLTALLQEEQPNPQEAAITTSQPVQKGKEQLAATFDKTNGGFGAAPKFPTPHHILFLLRYAALEKDTEALAMAEQTLLHLYKGGIFDHFGYGFCRYATDAIWLAPHFEKMLYDNALLAMAYLEAYQATGKVLYRQAATQIFTYVQRELTDSAGGFYCAQDADSQGEEGKYYLFTPADLEQALGKQKAQAIARYFDITPAGNFEGKSIPNLIHNPDFQSNGPCRIPQELTGLLPQLVEYRRNRCRLHKDDKILTAWNGMMIGALAKGYCTLGEPAYLAQARSAAAFIQQHMQTQEGSLLASWRQGQPGTPGFLDDYAYFCWALLELYQASFEPEYLIAAQKICRQMLQLFFDREDGGFFLYAEDGEQLILRPKEFYDGAVPAGNSVAAYVLQRLALLTLDPEIKQGAAAQNQYLLAQVRQYPAAHTFGLVSLMQQLYPSQQAVCITANASQTKQVKQLLHRHFLPQTSALLITPDNREALLGAFPNLSQYLPQAKQAVYYWCENQSCGKPLKTTAELAASLQSAGARFF